MLGKHYGVIMTFNALSKELHSLKQGSSKNIAEFRVHLLQQVQILQSGYPGRIQPEHMKEMKCDHFYEGLNPKYLWMLAHKVDGEHPASYSDLLLVAQKLERWAEARDPLPPKMAATNGSNIMHFQMPGNLFPSHKLKGNCTFPTWAVTIGNDEVKEDPGVKLEREGEMELSADKYIEVLHGVGETNQSIKYIVHFTKAVEIYQKINKNCFGCGSPDRLIQDCPKDISRSAQKVYWNMKEGTANKGGWAHQKPDATQQASLDKMPQA